MLYKYVVAMSMLINLSAKSFLL